MKKNLSIILVLAMLLSENVCAFSESAPTTTGTLFLTETQPYDSAFSLCWIDNDLYILGSRAVYRWSADMERPEVFCNLTEASAYQYIQQAPEDAQGASAWAKAIRYLFTNGGTLYGLHPYSGQVFEVTNAQLRPAAQFPLEQLKAGSEDAYFFREIKSVACSAGRLYLLLGTDDYADYAKTELFSFSLVDQSLTLCSPTGVQGVAAGAEGKLILLTQGEETALWQYDIASGTMDTQLAALQMEDLPSGLSWYNKKNMALYYASNRVNVTDLFGATQTKAYLPVSYADASTPAACSSNGIYAYPYGNYVFLRDVSIEGEINQTVLTLMGTISPNLIVSFSIENPDAAIVTLDTQGEDSMAQAVISADSSVDLLVASAPGDFVDMKRKGFAAPLNSSNELVQMVRAMYPTLQEVVFDGESLLAYPIAMQPYSWAVNETRWQELGLGEYPTTYDELFQAIHLWLEEYAQEYSEYTLSDLQQSSLDMLVSMIVREYIFQNETSGEQLNFDTPAFRSLMSSVSKYAYLLSAENEQWGMPLLSSYYQGFGCSYNDRDMTRMLLPPTLDKENEQALSASVEVLFVNAASRQQKVAERFILYCAQNSEITARYMMNPNMNDPYPNPYYESRMETLSNELTDLQTRLESADVSHADALREKILQTELTIERMNESKWSISPESIATYRKVAKNLRIPWNSVYLDERGTGSYQAISAVISQFCYDGLDASEIDGLINELNRVTYMVYMENQ